MCLAGSLIFYRSSYCRINASDNPEVKITPALESRLCNSEANGENKLSNSSAECLNCFIRGSDLLSTQREQFGTFALFFYMASVFEMVILIPAVTHSAVH